MSEIIQVTQSFIPPLVEYQEVLQRAWGKKWLTNRGELVVELEEKLKMFLDIPFVTLTTNGTLPIQIAIKALALKGEIITTPFSYVATTSSILWENCEPVFVDIHPEYFSIDEEKIERAITSKTTAILATHVFGNPCNVELIEAVALKYNLKVIYDGAHAFGVKYKGKSLLTYGDVSTCSFHATKIFHTGEGGGMFCNDSELHKKLFYMHNFGHKGHLSFYGLGINAKMSELQAAMGLAVWPHINYILDERKILVNYYNDKLDFSRLQGLKIREGTNWNYSYYPLVFSSEAILLKVEDELVKQNIIPRRYFYPSLNTLDFVSKSIMPISESVASRTLCLPLYVGLATLDLDRIILVVNKYS